MPPFTYDSFEDGFCLRCRYPLKGLPTNRCPECGRTFNPYDATTYASSAHGERTFGKKWLRPMVTGLGALSFAPLLALSFPLITSPANRRLNLDGVVWLLGIYFAICAMFTGRRERTIVGCARAAIAFISPTVALELLFAVPFLLNGEWELLKSDPVRFIVIANVCWYVASFVGATAACMILRRSESAADNSE